MRISRDQMMMLMAETVSGRSTCSRLKVGAIISRSARVVSTGYNGAPAGMDHCDHALNETEPCTWAIHAEANAIVWAARLGTSTEGADLYVTHSPCLRCAQLIVNAGIRRVVFRYEYRKRDGIEFLQEAGVDVSMLGSDQ